MPSGPQRAQRGLQDRDELVVDDPGGEAEAAHRDRRPRAQLGVAGRLGELDRAAQRAARRVAAGLHQRLAAGEQQAPAPALVGLGRVRERGEGGVEELGGALVGQARERLVPRALGVGEGAGRVGGRGALDEVVGQLAGGRVLALERVADGHVQRRAPGAGQIPVDRLADQAVHEAHAGDRPGGVLDELADDRGVQALERLGAGEARRPVERGHGEDPPLDGADLQQLAGLGRQRQQAPADRVAHAVGQRRAGALVERAAEPALRREQPHDLVGVQRVAVGQLQQRAHQRLRRLAAAAVQHERAEVLVGEAAEVQVPAEAGELAEDRLELGIAARAGVVVGRDDEHRHPADHARDEGQQQQRRLVGGLQVVDHDQQRPVGGERAQEERDPVEEREARAVGLQRVAALGQAEALAQLGGQADDPAGAGAERGAQLVVGGARGELADHLDPGPERRRAAAVPPARPHDAGAGAAGLLAQRLRQARLADARLARELDQRAAARGRLGERGGEALELGIPAQERQRATRETTPRTATAPLLHR